MRIDLHVHSSVSDGTEDPATLLETARRADLDVVALTDHDTIDGWSLAERARPRGLTVIPGMEFSCRWLVPDERPIGVHLLAYLFDPTHPGLSEERERLRIERLHRGRRIVTALVNGGYPLVWDEIVAGCTGGVVGRPHIARALVAVGAAESVEHAFATLLHSRSPYYVAKSDTEVREGIALVRAAGGVPVLAHGLATKRGRTVGDDAIAEMAAAGLLGLEVDHPDHTPAERAHLRGVAGDLGLIVTGSSDYHGTNKQTGIGICATDPAELDRILDAGIGADPFRD